MKKHVLCLGDSNTHGYCADPTDCADGGIRFNEEERWTCRLQTALGSDYLVTEEGLSGRTTVFVDPIHESMDALSAAYALLKSHEVIDPPRIKEGFHDPVMGEGCVERSAGVAEQFRVIAERQDVHFLDAEGCEFNQIDFMHLTRHGHAQLAEKLAELVPTLL